MRFLSLLLPLTAAILMICGPEAVAQTAPANQSFSAPAGPSANLPPAPPPATDDRTLEVAPRIIPVVPPSTDQTEPSEQEGADNSSGTPLSLAPAAHGRPYLGVSVQPALVRFHRQEIHGLEIIGVDKGSPADHAGLTAPTGMTTVGATGETAAFFLGPVGELMSPLLAHSGQLGATGDMIVAVDDQRVSVSAELNRVLARLAPGETVWFTLMRITPDGKVKNEKIPIVLGSADGAAPPAARSKVIPSH
ncbi:MAG TPA: PDZ domain-containing protein [Candidatus Binataceae bacterium]|nr:PDZ domain-containing protein [Candidatus Binataceae bacterium]